MAATNAAGIIVFTITVAGKLLTDVMLLNCFERFLTKLVGQTVLVTYAFW